MKVEDLILNPDNVMDYQAEDVHSKFGDVCLNAHMQINKFIESQIGWTLDGGGRYAEWLNEIGIQHQTENGWWNETAVDPANILAFIKYENEDNESTSLVDNYLNLKKQFNQSKKFSVSMIVGHTIVTDYIESKLEDM